MTRFAIYFVPKVDTGLWEFGCGAIGYDSHAGAETPFHDHAYFREADVGTLTKAPRRYGFHATLKAPFELADGVTVAALEQSMAAFAAVRQPIDIGHLQVSLLGRFLALTCVNPSRELNELAGDCVREFEMFRAPMSDADRRRRTDAGLNDAETHNLDRWGYPYVFDAFRFHMTLSGPVPDGTMRAPYHHALRELYSREDNRVMIDGITLCEQKTRDARFVVRHAFDFS